MSPAAIEETRQNNAMRDAFRKAKPLAPKKPAPANPPARFSKAPRRAPATPEESLQALIANIGLLASKGLLPLHKPAEELVALTGAADAQQLFAAMASLGYVRIHRGITGQVFFRKK
jgi:anti-sigma factor RsiW